jgi:MinD superfamily P-loop ATPase
MKHSGILTLMQAVGRLYVPRPEIDAVRCKACRKCERGCPMGAITMMGKVPQIDRTKCIRCYCCHEMCTDSAIRLRRSRAGRLMAWIMRAEGE